MTQIKCKCGNIYDSSYKFCPECAVPNPMMNKKKHKLTEVSADTEEKPAKKKFTKVGEGSLRSSANESPEKKSYSIVRQGKPTVALKQVSVEEPEDIYEDYEDDEEAVSAYMEDEPDAYYDYEDDSEECEDDEEDEYEDADFEDISEEDDYPVEDIEDSEEEKYQERFLPKQNENRHVLTAPTTKRLNKTVKSNITEMPKSKKISSTKSSLSKKKSDYDPNHDGYYDDRLPAILDEVTKTSHLDVFLKIGLSTVCIAALITYCIFYVQV